MTETKSNDLQARARAWIVQCFPAHIVESKTERNQRFLEEALELVQSTAMTAAEAHMVVDYVFSRPVGEPGQEVGGVLNTLCALCSVHGMDMMAEGLREMDRVERPEVIERIREKQKSKPRFAPDEVGPTR